MNTTVSTLSPRVALESSLSFLPEFFKKYWLIAVLYIIVASLSGFILNNPDIREITLGKSLQLLLISLSGFVLTLLMPYCGLKLALNQLDTKVQALNKSLPKSLWQMFCISFIVGVLAVPLLMLFIIPGIWWLIKSSAAYPNLLSTNDGIIESIRKSHELMNGRFWQCFGFICSTGFIIAVAGLILVGSLGIFLFIGGIFHSASLSGMYSTAIIFHILSVIISVISTVIYYYLQAWLYVYLKNTQTAVILPNVI